MNRRRFQPPLVLVFITFYGLYYVYVPKRGYLYARLPNMYIINLL